jgi:hypothetical protein
MLRGKGTCQTLGFSDDEKGDDDENDGDHDEVLIDTVVELTTSIAKMYGSEFGPHLTELMPSMLTYAWHFTLLDSYLTSILFAASANPRNPN